MSILTVWVSSLGVAGVIACTASGLGVLTVYRALTTPLIYRTPSPPAEEGASRSHAAA